MTKIAWSWAGVPSGPLGWISSNWTMPVLQGPIYPVMAQELNLQPDDDLLEVACGSGTFLATQATHVRHVAGLDLSDIQVGLARRRLADRIAAGTAEIVKGDAAALPWEDGRFSVVTCMGSVEAFPDPGLALAEMHRVLRAGGRAIVSLGAKVADGTETHRVLGAAWVWNEDDARRLVEAAGFVDVSVSYAPAGGDSRLLNFFNRLVGEEEMRIVRGVKPAAEAPAQRTEEPSRAPVGATG
ncbi:MAG: class I SAM-dependent methyltransferase [Candidatus Limnocylindrales bacterium]